jgi:hypothetical protein
MNSGTGSAAWRHEAARRKVRRRRMGGLRGAEEKAFRHGGGIDD